MKVNVLSMVALLVCGVCNAAELDVSNLNLNDEGPISHIWGKVISIMDEETMIVGLEDQRYKPTGYKHWVLIHCPTKGLTDGKLIQGEKSWMKYTGSVIFRVHDTVKIKTTDGGFITIFELRGKNGIKKK